MAASSSVSALLKQLSSASHTLNQASSKLTEQIKEIESSLSSYSFGIIAWVELRHVRDYIDDSDSSVERIDRLGYSKKNGKWALYVSSSIEETEYYETWLLRDAPRELRVLAIDAIPKLLEQMVIKAKELTAEVTNKTDSAKALAQSLRKPKKENGK